MKRMMGKSVSVVICLWVFAAVAPRWLCAQPGVGPPPWLVNGVNVAATVDNVVSAEGLRTPTAFYMLVRAQLPCTEWKALWAAIPVGLMGKVGCWRVMVPQDAKVPATDSSLVTFFVVFDSAMAGREPRRITQIARKNLDDVHHVLNAEMWNGNGSASTTASRVLAIWRGIGFQCEPGPISDLFNALSDSISAAGLSGGVQKKGCRGSVVGPVYHQGLIPQGTIYAFLWQVRKPPVPT